MYELFTKEEHGIFYRKIENKLTQNVLKQITHEVTRELCKINYYKRSTQMHTHEIFEKR